MPIVLAVSGMFWLHDPQYPKAKSDILRQVKNDEIAERPPFVSKTAEKCYLYRVRWWFCA